MAYFLAVIGTLPGILITVLGVKAQLVTNSLIGINVALFFGWLGFGALGDKFGRKRVISMCGDIRVYYFTLFALRFSLRCVQKSGSVDITTFTY